MRQDDYPHPVSEPAATGVPDYADDDSTAYEEVPSVREADGRDPAQLPADRDDGPVAVEEFGTTAEEQLRGESLEGRLAREEPDPALATTGGPGAGVASTAPEGELDEMDAFPGERGPEEGDVWDATVVDPHRDSPVSSYERIGADPGTSGLVGQLAQPDQGGFVDDEPDEVASDRGPAGGAGAEELAMHEVSEDDLTDAIGAPGDRDDVDRSGTG